jgi:hypothetical protein
MTSDFQLMAFRLMAADDLQGGIVTYGAAELPATVGVFSLRPELVSGGVTSHLMATVEVAEADLPDGAEFKNGQPITVSPNTGQPRKCMIKSFVQQGLLWQLEVVDENENA